MVAREVMEAVVAVVAMGEGQRDSEGEARSRCSRGRTCTTDWPARILAHRRHRRRPAQKLGSSPGKFRAAAAECAVRAWTMCP
eukprot:2219534-Prymnesium_polylepis.1